MAYKNKADRNYKREYALYQGTEEQKHNRAMRNAARREAIKNGDAKKGDGMDVHHTKALSRGGNNNNVRVVPASENRSFARTPTRKVKSETSTREKKNANRRGQSSSR